MVKLVAFVGHHHRVNHLTECRRARLYSMTASASGFEKSGLSSKVYAKFSAELPLQALAMHETSGRA